MAELYEPQNISLEEHLEDGRRLLRMSDADKDAWAAEIGQPRVHVDELIRRMAEGWRQLEGMTDEELDEFDALIEAQ